mmetsp:Transcript_36720/g.99345  ORF Transcript_36720/g.99345 Transcript_36720/m.99345 type:complete len:305 (+) Transcript_36720:2114-3028(+)
MRSMVTISARTMEVGAVKLVRALQRLSSKSCIRSCFAAGTKCSRTWRILVPSTPSEPEPRWPAAARPPRPLCLPPEGVLKSIQASRIKSKLRVPAGSMMVTSSSMDQTAKGHSRSGSGRLQSCTICTSESRKRCGSLPSFLLESCFKPLCKYSTASESKFIITAGSPPASLSPRLRALASASSASGLSTAASSSSSARSATEDSTSRTSGSTFFTQRSQMRGWGQVLSSSARLETQAFRTMMDSSADKLARTFTSKKSASASASKPSGSARIATTESKRARAAFRIIGFSSEDAARNMPGRSMY